MKRPHRNADLDPTGCLNRRRWLQVSGLGDPGREVRDQTNRPLRLADGQPLTALFG